MGQTPLQVPSSSSVQAYPVPVSNVGQGKGQRVQAYTSPFQHSQTGHSQEHPYGGGGIDVGGNMQQQAGAPSYASTPPDFKAWGFDGTTAQLGMQLGHSAVAAGQDYMQKNVCQKLLLSHFEYHMYLLIVRHPPPNIRNQTPLQRLQLVCDAQD